MNSEDDLRLPLGLPTVPPSSDPQRLLSYVLQVLPTYTAMELSATHYRLYTQQLRTDVDRWKAQATVTLQRLADEEEKRMFMERYAAEVVKERNEALHHKGAKKHKLWHNCCRQHASYDLDVTPSIVSLRGEKLTEMSVELKQARAALQEKDRLLDAAHELLNTKQIDFDAFVSAARKEKEQFEHQLATRAGLQSGLERRLAEAERQAYEDNQALAEQNASVDQLHERLEDLEAHVHELQNELVTKTTRIEGLEAELRALHSALSDTQEQLDRWQRAAHDKDVEIDTLHGQVDALTTADLHALQQRYAKQIETLTAQHEAQVRALEAQMRANAAPPPAAALGSARTPPRAFVSSFEKRMTLDEISSDTEDRPLLSPSYFQSRIEQSFGGGLGSPGSFQTPRQRSHHDPAPAHRRHSEGNLLSEGARHSLDSSTAHVRRRLLDDSGMSSSSSASTSRRHAASPSPSKRPPTPERQAIVSRLHALVQESEARRKLEEARADDDRAMLEALKQRVLRQSAA
ncbi:hypothetical protein ACHHYP_14775 [Achlya hypogyna]|uniref:Uncharacterized protein n=1 Tax=Achlya hypogyna TaxID=1202772 RepID=A0A1V9YCF9_ACHHY|nr:hypothetical protein ACHHYP_14775 [Achlya hypogyna]